VADGAGATSFARLWARVLARAFARGEWDGTDAGLPSLRRRWARIVLTRDLSWHAREKAAAGAGAAFLGLELTPAQGGRRHWSAVACGDVCLFHLRRHRLLRSFPLAAAGDFPRRPTVVSSRPGDALVPHRAAGSCRPGDALLIASDALGIWLLRTSEAGGDPWPALFRALALGPLGFADHLAAARRAGLGRDDATALLLTWDTG